MGGDGREGRGIEEERGRERGIECEWQKDERRIEMWKGTNGVWREGYGMCNIIKQ